MEALQATSGRSGEEAVSALEALTSRGIVTEVAEDAGAASRYDFIHEKLRALVCDETSLSAYPNNPDARKAIRAQAKCRKAM